MCIEWLNALQAPRLATLTISRKDVSFTRLQLSLLSGLPDKDPFLFRMILQYLRLD